MSIVIKDRIDRFIDIHSSTIVSMLGSISGYVSTEGSIKTTIREDVVHIDVRVKVSGLDNTYVYTRPVELCPIVAVKFTAKELLFYIEDHFKKMQTEGKIEHGYS